MRLFVAVNLPDTLRKAAWNSAAPLRDGRLPVKWVGVDALHLTLKFLGEVDAGRRAEVQDAVDAAASGTTQFALPVLGFGAFPNPRRARVIWLGCDSVPELELLQHRVEQRMSDIGFPLEVRPFHPHLTLGRVRRDARPASLAGLDDLLQRLQFQAQTVVKSVDLMQSELSRAGARYTRLHCAKLDSQ
ncbi:MAG: RNA 2',3'-cyclic phosphodiesterase [Gemmatimonadota bacterium]|nr:MAG: RNA 2',3'-cyclic phosphodiesterase [Gemmatimonadota bacterium]